MTELQIVAIAGVGGLGRYVCEVLSRDIRYKVIVLSRKRDRHSQDLGIGNVRICSTDYTVDSVSSILDTNSVTTLISTIQCPDGDYLPIHTNLLQAIVRSTCCKRLIPSDYAGNVEEFPDLPRAYGVTRSPFREVLRRTEGVEWTSLNSGWLMDYFVPQEKTFIRHTPGEFPIDLEEWSYSIRGTGDEPQSFTCARDIARAIAELLQHQAWDEVTYISGQFASFNHAAEIVEKFYGRSFSRSYRSAEEIRTSLQKHSPDGPSPERAIAEAEELTISGANCCPQDKVVSARDKFFKNLSFLTLEGLLEKAKTDNMI